MPEPTVKANETFLNGWIGERLAEQWFKLKGYSVEHSVSQQRGTEDATSAGDVDLIAKKNSEIIYIEVKFWEKDTLNPSWLVQFMLGKKLLKTLFETHQDATEHMLIFRYPSRHIFRFEKSENYKYIKSLIKDHQVPLRLLRSIDGQAADVFAKTIIEHLIKHKVKNQIGFRIVYFKEIINDLVTNGRIDDCRVSLEKELNDIFRNTFSKTTSLTSYEDGRKMANNGGMPSPPNPSRRDPSPDDSSEPKKVNQKGKSSRKSQSSDVDGKQSLTGLIKEYWIQEGKPRWDWDQLLRYAIKADQELERKGKNPAPTFRRHRQAAAEAKMLKYIRGHYKFPFSPDFSG